MDGDSLRVVHIMERMNIRGDGFVGGNETFQFHTEGGGLISSDVEMTSKKVIEIGGQSPYVNPVSAAVTAFTLGAISLLEKTGMPSSRMSRGGGNSFIAHPVSGWDCI